MKKKYLLSGLFLTCLFSSIFGEQSPVTLETVNNSIQESEIERFALYIGVNNGGKERETLRYAESDACSLADTMREIGGVKDENECVLLDPNINDIDDKLDYISRRIITVQQESKRTEFIFYYSGHSEEDGLLIGENKYTFPRLKAKLDNMPGDMHIVLLDSCYSGSFMRAKGGTKQKPFLMDDSTVVSGHAYLSSSSATEESQESDEIRGSYFTNSLVTGLRGAADVSGDKKVSLNELYYYAFNNTLSATEKTKSGPQHPEYSIKLVGSGDVVLTDLGTAESVLIIAEEITGTILVRYSDGRLATELLKKSKNSIAIALPAGTYQATVIDKNETKDSYFILSRDKVYTLNEQGLAYATYIEGRTRGRKAVRDFGEIIDIPFKTPLKISIADVLQIPFYPVYPVALSYNMFYGVDAAVSGCQINDIVGGIKGNLYGLQLNGIYGYIDGSSRGIQVSGIVGTSKGIFKGFQIAGIGNCSYGKNYGTQVGGIFNNAQDIDGIQVSGISNNANNVKGFQISGIVNNANNIDGFQIGLINCANNLNGFSIGLLSFIGNGIHELGFEADSDRNIFAEYRGGMPNLYTIISVGKKLDYESDIYMLRYGVGTSLLLKRLSFNIEAYNKSIYDRDDNKYYSWVPEADARVSLKLFKHFTVFAGAGVDFVTPFNKDYFEGLNQYSFYKDENVELSVHPKYFVGIEL